MAFLELVKELGFMMKHKLIFPALLVAGLALNGCSNLFSEHPATNIDYYTKVVDYYREYGTDEEYDYLMKVYPLFNPDDPSFPGFFLVEETRTYDENGIWDGLVTYEYDPKTAFSLTKSCIYEVHNGVVAERPTTTYRYLYYPWIEFSFNYIDTCQEPLFYLYQGITYDTDDNLTGYYVITYHHPNSVFGPPSTKEQAKYYQVLDYTGGLYQEEPGTFSAHQYLNTSAFFGAYLGNPIAVQEGTWVEIPATSETYLYSTEKFFDSTDGVTLHLTQEFAGYHDAAGVLTHELFHTRRLSSSYAAGEALNYYLVRFERDPQGRVYRQLVNEYTDAAIASHTITADGSYDPAATHFTGTLTTGYQISFPAIGAIAETLDTTWDSTDNILRDVRSAYGSETERYVYRYNGLELASEYHYVNGKTVPYDRTEIRWTEAQLNGEWYSVREELTYRYESDPSQPDYDTNQYPRSARSAGLRSAGIRAAANKIYKPKSRSYHGLR
jgi:hypothetical protein